jgi:hypothetical protein
VAKLPTDRELLRAIYDRYYREFDPGNPSRLAKVLVPLDLALIANEVRVDSELVFGRLYYHLEPKYGAPNGKDDIHLFSISASTDGKTERHVVNFPLLESALATLEYEHRKFQWATGIAFFSVAVALIALAVSIIVNVFGHRAA